MVHPVVQHPGGIATIGPTDRGSGAARFRGLGQSKPDNKQPLEASQMSHA